MPTALMIMLLMQPAEVTPPAARPSIGSLYDIELDGGETSVELD